jgi:hypothetical protein
VAVVLPDCRRNSPNPHAKHLDKQPAEPHAGYIRFDLANLSTAAMGVKPGNTVNGPAYEGIHRFDRQEVDFGLGDKGEIVTKDLVLPNFGGFAPDLKPHSDLFDSKPQSPILMRTVLRSGKLEGKGRKNWKIPPLFNPNGKDHTGFFAGDTTWIREVDDLDELSLTIRSFDTTGKVEIPLRPVTVGPKNVIRLNIANLCCNPMEWEELASPSGDGADKDFKWLYRLMNPQSSTYEELLAGDKELPHPDVDPDTVPLGREHCIGARADFDFTEQSTGT